MLLDFLTAQTKLTSFSVKHRLLLANRLVSLFQFNGANEESWPELLHVQALPCLFIINMRACNGISFQDQRAVKESGCAFPGYIKYSKQLLCLALGSEWHLSCGPWWQERYGHRNKIRNSCSIWTINIIANIMCVNVGFIRLEPLGL